MNSRPGSWAALVGRVGLAAVWLIGGWAFEASAQDAASRGLAIARAADRANQGFVGERNTMSMELVNAHGDVTRRKLRVETLEGTPGDAEQGDRTRIVLESPADVQGTKLLTWNHGKRDDDQWLYLPAIKRVKRISGSNKRGSFVGSEFSYEDLASNQVDKFSYKYLDEPVIGGRATFRYERTSRDPESAYSRQVLWLDKQYQLPLQIEFFDRAGALLKRAIFVDHRAYARLWRPSTVTMENLQTKKRTVIRWDDRQLGLALPAEHFDSARLED
jgi:hypothetical protein